MGLKSSLTPIVVGCVWIAGCEYGINEYWLKSQWTDYLSGIGIAYPGSLENILVWMGWCLVYALTLRIMLSRFDVLLAGLTSWILVFGMTLISLANFGAMPTEMLKLYVPASLAEAISAAVIMAMFVSFNRSRARSMQRAKEKAKAKGKPVAA